MKKKIAAVSMILICLAISVSGTLAYFTASERAHNVITTSGIGIELAEKQEQNGVLVDFPKEGIFGVMPGASVSKIVSVVNDGGADAWIRVWVNVSISEGGDPIANPTIKNLPLTITGKDGEPMDVITLDVDNASWIVGADGYYYYHEPLAAGAETNALFKTVSFVKEMGNEYQNCKVLIDVTAEAVQSDNNDPRANGGNADDVKGWPTEVNR